LSIVNFVFEQREFSRTSSTVTVVQFILKICSNTANLLPSNLLAHSVLSNHKLNGQSHLVINQNTMRIAQSKESRFRAATSAIPQAALPPTVDPLNPLCNDWTSLSVICFGVCELSIRQIRAETN